MKTTETNNRRTLKVLTFRLNKKTLAIPVADIAEVNRLAQLTAVPKAPDCVLGVINYHGKTTPVLNLKKLLDFSPSELKSNAMWFASGDDESFVCLAVDELGNFADLPADSLDDLPDTAGGAETGHVKSYARIDGEVVQILDVRHVISDRILEFFRASAGGNQTDASPENAE